MKIILATSTDDYRAVMLKASLFPMGACMVSNLHFQLCLLYPFTDAADRSLFEGYSFNSNDDIIRTYF